MEKAPKKVKAPEGEFTKIAANKEYEVIGSWGSEDDRYGHRIIIVSDTGIKMYCLEKRCAYIDEEDWIVTEREQ